jgi:hypothetical protein
VDATSGRSRRRRLGAAIAAALVCGAVVVPVLGRAAAAQAGPVAALADRDHTPTPHPTHTPKSEPTSTAPATPAAPAPASTPTSRATLRISLAVGNAVLGSGYWTGAAAGAFTIRVGNTGTVDARLAVGYGLPAGVTETGGSGCTGGGCAAGTLGPGDWVDLRVTIAVAGDAWRAAPLGGQVWVTATGGGLAPVTDQAGWSLVFPPGPPAPGIALQLDNVTLSADGTAPASLGIRLTNTGGRPAAGRIDVLLPDGITAQTPPPGCQSQPQASPPTVTCDLGTVPPGTVSALAIPLLAGAAARARAPLAGLVRANLTQVGQPSVSTQCSYQILAPAVAPPAGTSASATAAAGPVALPAATVPVGSAPSRLHPLAFWPIVGGGGVLLLVVIVGLLVALRGRPDRLAQPAGADPVGGDPAGPAGVLDPLSRAHLPLTLRWRKLPASPPPPV